MLVEHRLEFACRCPVNDRTDLYGCVVRCRRLVKVEDILAAVAAATESPAFQEDLTETLARTLGCQVETAGWHSAVRTLVVCGEP